MSQLFNDTIVQGVIAGVIVALVLGIFGWLKFKRDEKIVSQFLKKSGFDTGRTKRRRKRHEKES